MDKKSLVVMVSVGVLVFIAIALLISYVLSGGSLKTEDLMKTKEEALKPVIELTLNSEDYTTESVIIEITAYMKDGSEIEAIILPNSQEVISATTKYEVTRNGEYEFIAKGKNGEETRKSIIIDQIIDASADNPYIPDGFEHVEGTEVDTGYTIIDKYGNEFVWIPVSIGMLYRDTDGNVQYEEDEEELLDLLESVKRYFGFYIAKYEASEVKVKDKTTIASKANQMPLSNVSYNTAYDKANNMSKIYKYKDVDTMLMSSYTWDTTLNWVNKTITNYSKNVSYGNYSGIIKLTGATQSDIVNNICDLSGNLREWTTEKYYAASNVASPELNEIYRVIRGGSAIIEKAASSHIVYPDTMTDTYWGFRVVLYKK